MRLVLDTNVLFAAYISRGTCAALYEQILATETLITSEPILSEFEQALLLKARVPPADAAAARHQTRGNAEIVHPASLPARVCRDADDDAILGTAIAAGAEQVNGSPVRSYGSRKRSGFLSRSRCCGESNSRM